MGDCVILSGVEGLEWIMHFLHWCWLGFVPVGFRCFLKKLANVQNSQNNCIETESDYPKNRQDDCVHNEPENVTELHPAVPEQLKRLWEMHQKTV